MPMNALQRLIHAHCQDTGDSLSDVAARGGLSRQTVSALMHREGPRSLPHRNTIVKLARGLGVSIQTVEAAASAAAAMNGGHDHEDPRLATLMDLAERLPEAKLRALTHVARVLSDAR